MGKAVIEENNKQIANCGFRDEAHDLPKNSFTFNIPYSLTVYAYKLNLFAPIRKARPSVHRFFENHKSSVAPCADILNRISPKSDNKYRT